MPGNVNLLKKSIAREVIGLWGNPQMTFVNGHTIKLQLNIYVHTHRPVLFLTLVREPSLPCFLCSG